VCDADGPGEWRNRKRQRLAARRVGSPRAGRRRTSDRQNHPADRSASPLRTMPVTLISNYSANTDVPFVSLPMLTHTLATDNAQVWEGEQ
jgi:hypothetical protein